MKLNPKIGLSVLALSVSGQVLAQATFGYQVSWGTQAVPLSPWANALIVAMLAVAAYAFLRKRAGRGMMLLVGAALVGGLSLQAQDNALAIISTTTDTISTPAGSMTLTCNAYHDVETDVSGGVTLTVVPINGAPTPIPANGECATGTHLNPGNTCHLCLD